MDKDRVKGSAEQAKGKIKETAGKITGDGKTEAEGKTDQVKGKVQNTVGALRIRCAATKPIHNVQKNLERAGEEEPTSGCSFVFIAGFFCRRVCITVRQIMHAAIPVEPMESPAICRAFSLWRQGETPSDVAIADYSPSAVPITELSRLLSESPVPATASA
jgi:uncharacterized protein YjbJ (UPF0337 family)